MTWRRLASALAFISNAYDGSKFWLQDAGPVYKDQAAEISRSLIAPHILSSYTSLSSLTSRRLQIDAQEYISMPANEAIDFFN